MEPVNSLAARDVRSVDPPVHRSRPPCRGRPAGAGPGRSGLRARRARPALPRGHGGPVVRQSRLQRGAPGRGGARADEPLPTYHLFGGKSHGPAIALAERLLALAPAPMSKVLFTCSGSEANDTALKLVRYYHHAIGKPDKHKVISRVRAYHGVTLACASLTGLPHVHRDFGLPLPDILHTECPHHYRYALPGETEEAFATRLGGGAGAPDPARGAAIRSAPSSPSRSWARAA